MRQTQRGPQKKAGEFPLSQSRPFRVVSRELTGTVQIQHLQNDLLHFQLHSPPTQNVKMRCAILIATLVALIAIASAAPQNDRPRLTAEASHTRFPGGHSESVKVTQDAWVSKDGNWKAGGYVQHDRMKFGGQGMKNTHGGISITGRF
ncbi:hypothetical protein GE061_014339 [Apolygus lucorum]|uniref:Uncharacterized protein n=1 Tax=Apolygus lucorum TaxID=248454 RepID=A0A8S9XQK2_APOLU|nr:hypothetical protein GE061_014339 [Apolygus lucorum]